MNGYNFTERVRKVLAMAREETTRLRHEYVAPEHILLALIRDGEGVAAAVLQNLSTDPVALGARVEEFVKPGRAGPNTGPDLPYTSRAKKVLEQAMSEARELSHTYVGTEHLLLGLLREEKAIAAQVLREAGLTVDSVRAQTLRLLESSPEPKRQSRPIEFTQTFRPLTPVSFTVHVDVREGQSFEARFSTAADAIAYLRSLSPPGPPGAPPPAT